MNNEEDPIKGLLVQLAMEGKIAPESAGLTSADIMPAMPQEPTPESTALPETFALKEMPMAEAKDIKIKPEKEKKAKRYDWPTFSTVYSIPDTNEELFDSVQYVESRNLWDAVSKSNAIGLMQIKPQYSIKPGYGAKNIFEVAEELGVNTSNIPKNTKGATKLLYIPEVNRKYGEGYLQAMVDEFGDVATGLIAYNNGPKATKKWLREGGKWSELGEEPREYLDKIERTLNGEDVYASKD